MLAQFAGRLAATPLSQLFQAKLWVVPLVQCVHILAIAAVMASVWVFSFRIIGISGRVHAVSEISRDVVPWIWRALIVLLASGSVLIIAEPARELTNPVFLFKMALIPIAAAPTLAFQIAIRRNAARWDRPEGNPVPVKAFAALLLGLWLTVAVAGRLIAYAEHA